MSSDNHISIMDNQNFHSHHHAPTFQHTLLHWMLHQNFCTICHLHWTCRQLHGFFQSGFAVHATFRSYFSSLMPNGNIWLEANVYSQQFMQKLLQRIPVFVSILWILGSVVLQFPKNEMFQTWNEWPVCTSVLVTTKQYCKCTQRKTSTSNLKSSKCMHL